MFRNLLEDPLSSDYNLKLLLKSTNTLQNIISFCFMKDLLEVNSSKDFTYSVLSKAKAFQNDKNQPLSFHDFTSSKH